MPIQARAREQGRAYSCVARRRKERGFLPRPRRADIGADAGPSFAEDARLRQRFRRVRRARGPLGSHRAPGCCASPTAAPASAATSSSPSSPPPRPAPTPSCASAMPTAEAGACGNATRCVAACWPGRAAGARQVIRTVAGNLPGEHAADGARRRRHGRAAARLARHPAGARSRTRCISILPLPRGSPIRPPLSMGNPHATFFVADVAAVAVAELGPALEHHPLFPERANIGFAQVLAPRPHPPAGVGARRRPDPGLRHRRLRRAGRRASPRPGRPPRARSMLDGGALEIEWRGGRPRAHDRPGRDRVHRRDRPRRPDAGMTVDSSPSAAGSTPMRAR